MSTKTHTHKHDNWHTYYQNHKGIPLSNILLHWQYLLDILSSRPQKLLEIGCGPADHSILIKKFFPHTKISLLDLDNKILENLKKEYNGKVEGFYLCDLASRASVLKQKFSKDQFDVIFSQGLMEHFNDKKFIAVIQHCMPYTKRFIASIPADTYPNHDYGDEILRDQKQIESLLQKIPGITFRVKKYFPDIGFRTKYIAVKKARLNIVKAVFFMILNGCHYLIEIEKI